MSGPPYAFVFAGPNGSGKTTIIEIVIAKGLTMRNRFFPFPEHYINPDAIAKGLPGEFDSEDQRNRAAQAQGIELRAQAIREQRSFAYETVMSHPTRINEFLELQRAGYIVLLVFITASDPEINVRRVTERFQTKATTGHFVKPDAVRERYSRVMTLLPVAAEIVDGTFLYDNSQDFQAAKLVGFADANEVLMEDHAPGWALKMFLAPLLQRTEERVQFAEAVVADQLSGHYVGIVAALTDEFVVQELSDGQKILHDRRMLEILFSPSDGPDIEVGQSITVRYSAKMAPSIDRAPPFADDSRTNS